MVNYKSWFGLQHFYIFILFKDEEDEKAEEGEKAEDDNFDIDEDDGSSDDED